MYNVSMEAIVVVINLGVFCCDVFLIYLIDVKFNYVNYCIFTYPVDFYNSSLVSTFRC